MNSIQHYSLYRKVEVILLHVTDIVTVMTTLKNTSLTSSGVVKGVLTATSTIIGHTPDPQSAANST